MKNIILITMLTGLLAGCASPTLYFDKYGVAHGTGWREYQYKSGELMQKDRYENDQLEQSIWFKPDGSVIREEDWQDQSGTGLYLRQDGSIRAAMPFVNGLGHGMTVYYNPDGTVSNVVEFIRGKKQE